MKRFVCLLFVLILIPLFAFASSSYTPSLKMYLSDLLSSYNSIGTPFNTPLVGLTNVYKSYLFDGYQCFEYLADKYSGTHVVFFSSDPFAKSQNPSCGIDRIQISINDTKHFLSFVTVADRLVSLFAPNLFGMETSSYFVTQLMKDFYQNNCLESGQSYYRQLEDGGDIYLWFYYSDNYYTLEICSGSFLTNK